MLKAFFLLLLVAFGAVMFAAGTLAPSNLKAPIERLAAQTAALLPGEAPKTAAGSSSASSASSSTGGSTVAGGAVIAKSAAPAGAANPANVASPVFAASAPIASLLVPAPPPAHGHYALQAATFTSSDAASLFAGSVSEQGYKATIVPITDSGQPLIVAVGDYPSPEAASADQLVVGRQLKSTALPPVVLLPPPAH
ncbi:SPOR domain-containing protein [Paraburkholderia bryophila]|uniref:Sporulation related protein n=1 Tax=Paraburkholderia bryophila TaxID=420952 RepID=A0A329CHU7_9BURK|nr:SPOR domain-containing protein [Paraburkholderia bryophila]RAS33261.1 sporulation related protein [Paraburkholderia bryophila]